MARCRRFEEDFTLGLSLTQALYMHVHIIWVVRATTERLHLRASLR